LSLIKNLKTIIGDQDISYYTGGQGEPVIVIHGGTNGGREQAKYLSELAKRYTVYLPDLPGFGNSQPLEGSYFIPEFVEFIDKFAHQLGLDQFHLIGHSFGGGVALNYVLKFPHKVTKLVLVSSMCLGREIAWWVRLLSTPGVLKCIGPLVLGYFRAAKWLNRKLALGNDFTEPFTKASIMIASELTTLREQSLVLFDRLGEVMLPTLIVWGDKDRIVPARQAYAAAASIPSCQVKVFDNCGHSVYRRVTLEFSRLVRGFLN
jgi:pimeloyl-ACP methyl ester carboxylesterase